MSKMRPTRKNMNLLIGLAAAGWLVALILLAMAFGGGGFLSGSAGGVGKCSLDDVPVTCSGANLSGDDLRGYDMTGAQLDMAALDDANFSGNLMVGANLTNSTLTNSDLNFVDLTNADLSLVDFSGADLRGALLVTVSGMSTITWDNTLCPDGTNSDDNGGTCENNLEPLEHLGNLDNQSTAGY